MANFDDIVTGLLMQYPFYGSLLMRLKHVPDSTLQPPTACVTPDTIRYHPDFFAKMKESEALFVICHEIRHLVFDHLGHMRHFLQQGMGPDGKPYDREKYNAAADYVINDGLKHDGCGEMPSVGLWDPRYTYEMTPAEVYCLLDQPGQKKVGRGDGGGGSMDGHDPGDLGDPSECQGPITPSAIMQAANLHQQVMGSLPAGVDRLIGEIRKPAVNPWARLRKLVTATLRGYDNTTWRRLHRTMIVRGIGMPSRAGFRAGTVAIVGDTSGSIGDEMLQLFGGHTGAILDAVKPKVIKMIWCDSAVQRVDDIKDGTDLRRSIANAPGGGGTDMREGVREALKYKPDVIIVLTDGYTPFCDAGKVPCIWAITEPGITSPYGETVYIGEG
jgi:predicted metal-dependent peptidase